MRAGEDDGSLTGGQRAQQLADMPRLAELAAEVGRARGFLLDFSPASADEVERLIADGLASCDPIRRAHGVPGRQHQPLWIGLGAYVGELLVRNLGGVWAWHESGRLGVQAATGWTFPLAAAERRFANGSEDDLAAVFRDAARAPVR